MDRLTGLLFIGRERNISERIQADSAGIAGNYSYRLNLVSLKMPICLTTLE